MTSRLGARLRHLWVLPAIVILQVLQSEVAQQAELSVPPFALAFLNHSASLLLLPFSRPRERVATRHALGALARASVLLNAVLVVSDWCFYRGLLAGLSVGIASALFNSQLCFTFLLALPFARRDCLLLVRALATTCAMGGVILLGTVPPDARHAVAMGAMQRPPRSSAAASSSSHWLSGPDEASSHLGRLAEEQVREGALFVLGSAMAYALFQVGFKASPSLSGIASSYPDPKPSRFEIAADPSVLVNPAAGDAPAADADRSEAALPALGSPRSATTPCEHAVPPAATAAAAMPVTAANFATASLGLANLLTMWPVLLALHISRAERLVPLAPLARAQLALNAALALCFNASVSLAIARCSPVSVSAASVLAAPTALVFDAAVGRVALRAREAAGAAVVVLACVVIVLCEPLSEWPAQVPPAESQRGERHSALPGVPSAGAEPEVAPGGGVLARVSAGSRDDVEDARPWRAWRVQGALALLRRLGRRALSSGQGGGAAGGTSSALTPARRGADHASIATLPAALREPLLT